MLETERRRLDSESLSSWWWGFVFMLNWTCWISVQSWQQSTYCNWFWGNRSMVGKWVLLKDQLEMGWLQPNWLYIDAALLVAWIQRYIPSENVYHVIKLQEIKCRNNELIYKIFAPSFTIYMWVYDMMISAGRVLAQCWCSEASASLLSFPST